MRLSLHVASGLLALALAGPLTESASAEPAWPTYHRDSIRSGVDPDATQPIAPTLAWQSQSLGAPIYGQPLILGSRVYVATSGDKIFALEAATGAVVWEKGLGAPVPASALQCGNINPTVGVIGTPVIDPSRNVIYAVADTWDAGKKEARHVLKGLDLSSGAEILNRSVDPPGTDAKAMLQRTALNLDRGNVVFGFGGNYGDCGSYRGTVVSAPEDGGPPSFWLYTPAPPSTSGGAIWGPSGPAIDGEGHIYATTGNPNPQNGEDAETYDYSDSVIELDQSLNRIGNFKPPSWLTDSNNDTDLGSAGPELLPGGLLFQAGKNGTGYLIGEATMGSEANAVYSAQVCAGQGSFGGDAYAAGVIYIPCTNGVQALAYNQAARTFTPLWKGPSDAVGPPTLSAGLVWSVATGGSKGGGTKLYGLDPSTGVPRYTEILPSGVDDHFASPSAAGGRLFVSTGSTVSAYQVAGLSPGAGGAPPAISAPGVIAAPGTIAAPAPPVLLRTHLRADKNGRVRIALRCGAPAVRCKGTLTLRAKLVKIRLAGNKRTRRVVHVTLARAGFSHAKGTFGVTIRLGPHGRGLLKSHGGRLRLQVIIAAPPAKTRTLAATLIAAR